MKNKKIAIIGHFGGNKQFFDGQTVKTIALYEELKRTFNYSPYKVDTYYKKCNPLKLLWQTLACLFTCDDIFVLLSSGGMKIYFPLLFLASKIKKIRIYHDVIGGNLDQIIQKHPKFCKYLNSFTVNWVETNSLKVKLEKLGVYNAEMLPNFKNLNAIPMSSISPYNSQDGCYSFCTFSRVLAEKGITDAINSILAVNLKYQKNIAKLHIYGPIDESYREEFEKLVACHKQCISYKGIVNSNDSVEVLKNYFAMLFPTKWNGEGFPGTVLDCYASGLPVIASDWNSNSEIINHMKTGLIYPSKDFANLTDAIEWSIVHHQKIDSMRVSCRSEYEKYTPEQIISIIKTKLCKNK